MTDPLFAVHIADGVLTWPWLAGGFALAGLLALLACWRLREDEVPRVALMTAAFFVASSIHVKLGPSSVHLLLNGLVGVVLGWRAPVAILLGVTLQAVLIPHGGLTTIGVNASTEALPALAAWALFGPVVAACRRWPGWAGPAVFGAASVVWGAGLLFGLAALWTGGLSEAVRATSRAGVVVSVSNFDQLLAIVGHPAALAGLGAFAVLSAVIFPCLRASPELPAGVLIGVLSVVLTTLLVSGVLLLDRAGEWGRIVEAIFVAHLPLALIEGLILGVTVGLLARVKPAMLRLPERSAGATLPRLVGGETAPLLALAGLLLLGGPARAHLLNADVTKVDVAKRQVTIESWYETGDPPTKASVKVYRSDGGLLTSGGLDAKGAFVFTYDRPERLLVVIDAGDGHRKEVRVASETLGGGALDGTPVPAKEESGSRGRDLLLGLAVLLSLGAFIMSWLTGRRVRRLMASDPGHGRQDAGG